jgi:pimeloyl-ACP methyl ester carboxylesterase
METQTHTLAAPGATITYDVRPCPDGRDGPRPLVLVGSPMEAVGFTTLAGYFTDRTVITLDPRGVGRSVRTDPIGESTPELHADDLRMVIEAVGAPFVDVFGSSGGAVNGLALVAQAPERIHTYVAHEPPTAAYLPDRAPLLAAIDDIYETYQRRGQGPAMAKFLALITFEGELTGAYADQPDPDPATIGLPIEDDGSRDDPMIGQNMRTCSAFVPDLDALRAAATRVVIGAGRESARQMTGRAAASVAEQLGIELTVFPSHHGGFLGGEFGQHGDPPAFAAALRHVLGSS